MTLAIHTSTRASREADENFTSNLNALRSTQPRLIASIEPVELDVEWLSGRDGARTARDPQGRWLAGCSLPRRAAREMLKRLETSGAVACFLAPTHAAQLAVALERMRPERAIVALVPAWRELALMLRCEDFADAITAHRLWFVAGETWASQLSELYDEHIGLAPPAQFIRVAATGEEVLQSLIAEAQRVISDITTRRAAAVQRVRSQLWNRPSTLRLCVVAPLRYRLWNDVGHELLTVAEDASRLDDRFRWELYDADDPARGSPLALATLARSCGAILTANTARCDLPGLLPDELPWITRVTAARIPTSSAAGPRDHLILPDESVVQTAIEAGWDGSRLHVAACGFAGATAPAPDSAPDRAITRHIALIADTGALDTPEDLNEYSSHTILWESIADELLRDPFALVRAGDAARYLESRMRQLDIADQAFPRTAFINRLILPAYQLGIARALLRANLPVHLHGEGWAGIAEFAPHAQGPVESRQQLASIVGAASALMHVWPGVGSHPVELTARPLVRADLAPSAADLLAESRRAMNATSCLSTACAPMFSGALLRRILACG